jgi:chromosome segregation ATPase
MKTLTSIAFSTALMAISGLASAEPIADKDIADLKTQLQQANETLTTTEQETAQLKADFDQKQEATAALQAELEQKERLLGMLRAALDKQPAQQPTQSATVSTDSEVIDIDLEDSEELIELDIE